MSHASLEDELAHLRSENSSLAAAAEDLSAATEAYAADASQWRQAVSALGTPDVVARFREVSDASRRQQKRLDRMGPEAARLRDALALANARADGLQSLLDLADETARALRAQVEIVGGRPCRRREVPETAAYAAMRDAMVKAVEETSPGERDAARVAAHAAAAAGAVGEVGRAAAAMVAWAGSSSSPRPGPDAVAAAQQLERTASVGPSFGHAGSLAANLSASAARAALALVPPALWSAPPGEVDLPSVIARLVARAPAGGRMASDTPVSADAALRARCEAAEAARKDAQARADVFERRIAPALRSKAEAAKLRARLAERDAELARVTADVERVTREAAERRITTTASSRSASASRSVASAAGGEADGSVPADACALALAASAEARRARRLRSQVASHYLADLSPDADAAAPGGSLEEMRTAIRAAARICKRSAAGARIVRLDARTLAPVVDGTALAPQTARSTTAIARKEVDALSVARIASVEPQRFRIGGGTRERVASFAAVSRALNTVS